MNADPASFLAPVRPRILAHRGLSLDAPENTLLAFLAALAAGATHIETDVHATSDGVAVISHDATLADGRAVNRVTMAQLARVGLGRGQSYCSLGEALAAFPEARFNIDVKSTGAVVPTARAVLSAGAGRRVLLTSFSETRRRRVVRAVPGAVSSASARGVALTVLVVALHQRWALPRLLRGISAIQVPERAGPFRIATPRMIRQMHLIGVEVHVWTVNDPAQMRRLLDLGVDGLVTDRADLAARLRSDRATRPSGASGP